MKIQCVLKRDREFGGWLYNGKVLAPNASAVLRRNLLKYLFLVKIVCLIKMIRLAKRWVWTSFLKIRRPSVEVLT